jgi:SecD/SecF fusion protein
MKKSHIVLIVVAASLPLVLIVLSMAAFVLLPLILRATEGTKPVSAVLLYEVDPPDMPVNMDAMMAAVERRVNPGWTRRGRVRQVGDLQIEIGVYESSPEAVRRIDRLVMSLGTLEFRILANRHDHKSIIDMAEADDGDRVRDAEGRQLAWWVPVSRGQEGSFTSPEIATREVDRAGMKSLKVLVVNDPFNVNGGYLTRAEAGVDQSGRPCILFKFNSSGGQLFRGLTENNLPDEVVNVYRSLGIILDGWLYSAPRVISPIGQDGQITGDFTREEVEDLVDVLNAGSLPARLRKVENAEPPEDAGEAADQNVD